METRVYMITCMTNMHAGSGSADQGVIDNLVQRDFTDNLPCVFASSLKGALREYFEEVVLKQEEKQLTQDLIDGIFGGKNGKIAKGNYIFHDALLLSIPARSNKEAFFQVTSPMVLKRWLDACEMFGIAHQYDPLKEFYQSLFKDGICVLRTGHPFLYNYPNVSDLSIEYFSTFEKKEGDVLKELLGDKYLIVSDEDFKMLTDDYNLPVIARNQLESGVSKNLFYEQIVPRQSKFFFFVNRIVIEDQGNAFDAGLRENIKRTPVQIGANASIGYGYCAITACTGLKKDGNEQ